MLEVLAIHTDEFQEPHVNKVSLKEGFELIRGMKRFHAGYCLDIDRPSEDMLIITVHDANMDVVCMVTFEPA